MKILLTGSRGMVGKEVLKILKKKNEITEFDYSLGDDILNKEKLDKKMKGIECVIHLAGIIDTDAKNLWEVNVTGTKNVLNSAINAGAKKFVFMSTTGVYGETKGITDEKTPINPKNKYEKSKAKGEEEVLQKKNKIEVCIIRSAMVLGANEYWKKMFQMLIKKYPLPLDGKNTFQVIYSKELAGAVALVAKKGKSGEIYLASGKEKNTLNKFCEIVQGELGLGKKLTHIPSLIGIIAGKILKIKLLTADNLRHLGKERNYRAKKIEKLGWKSKTPSKKAIREIIKELKIK
jgi:nucleoside-diphosphate-sugar epimerase